MSNIADLLLRRIYASRTALIKVVTYLLHDLRATTSPYYHTQKLIRNDNVDIPCDNFAAHPTTLEAVTLASLLDGSTTGKRKRSITLFNGRPFISIIPPTPFQSRKKGHDVRKVVRWKKVIGLGRAMQQVDLDGLHRQRVGRVR